MHPNHATEIIRRGIFTHTLSQGMYLTFVLCAINKMGSPEVAQDAAFEALKGSLLDKINNWISTIASLPREI